jgi:hypothetical protein
VRVSPAEPRLDPTAVQDALAEIRGMADQFDQFFTGVFDELQSVAADLLARHNCQGTNAQSPDAAAARPALDRQVCESLEELRRAQGETRQVQEETRRLLDQVLTIHRQLLEQGNLANAKT